MIISAWWIQTSSKLSGKKSRKQPERWTTPKRMRIRPKYSATVTLTRQEDIDGTNKRTNNISCKL